MHGVTKEVNLKAVVRGIHIDPSGNVGDKVNISLDISAVKQE